MATQKRSSSQVVPFVIVSLVTLIFMIWAMRQCSQNESDYAMIEEQETREDYLERRDSILRDSIRKLREAQPQVSAAESLLSDAEQERLAREAALLRARTQPLPGDSSVYLPGQVNRPVVVQKETTLYSTIDGLNVRVQPKLGAPIIGRLNLYEQVTYMNEVTDSLFTIDLGEVTPTEPWVKIRLDNGKQGWVYGAGVSFYKYKLEGVLN
ncbi:SH3 domain-containing protein [Neolewinella xylanilytica]|uniref:SH3 domain-containing protein n=1 Tax=Neolewinella xylanilytica TaxID=1514080 RepID=A0A2S6I190_9BACT|nr:SH3 domain-containing protein [Neolewinella xylanilytica]PPK84738.1 SH3 domain-containing protein [Neolewinella xylanilytica]